MDRSIDKSELADAIDAALAAVRDGESVTITDGENEVARLVPAVRSGSHDEAKRRRDAAFEALMAALKSREPKVIGPWTREELYDRGRW